MRLVLAIMLGSLTAGCADTQRIYTPLGKLESRSRVIAMEKGPDGIVYTILGKDGRVIADRATLAEVQTREPWVGQLLKTGWAGEQ